MEYFQQGDVMLKPSEIPKGAKKLATRSLKASQVTGHSHTAQAPAAVYRHEEGLYVKAPKKFRLTHQEHKTLEIPAGAYLVDEVQEFDHLSEEARAVAD